MRSFDRIRGFKVLNIIQEESVSKFMTATVASKIVGVLFGAAGVLFVAANL